MPGFRIHKAGVILTELCDAKREQQELALDAQPASAPALRAAMDRLNDRYEAVISG